MRLSKLTIRTGYRLLNARKHWQLKVQRNPIQKENRHSRLKYERNIKIKGKYDNECFIIISCSRDDTFYFQWRFLIERLLVLKLRPDLYTIYR